MAEARKLPAERVSEIADGRIFTGARAVELGLVDELGNFRDAVDAAGGMAGIDGEAELLYPEEKFDLRRLLREHMTGALLDAIRGSVGRIEYRWDGGAG